MFVTLEDNSYSNLKKKKNFLKKTKKEKKINHEQLRWIKYYTVIVG